MRLNRKRKGQEALERGFEARTLLMLRNLKSPETYFQAAFRVQSPWSIKNPNDDNPNEEEVLKPVCFVFDFAPTRALHRRG